MEPGAVHGNSFNQTIAYKSFVFRRNGQPADISARTKKELANENKPRTLPSTGDLDEAIALPADAMPEGVYP